ncbi:response regulator [Puniceicoccales bacterium CK1056]|uniref:histidine kinase n=1 Tax=Oceanipulchritudo coccoides TaxID=2706888 RepID=A0A6B2LWY6_9BACT|nr:ATP-binding protein [Oceanipulchritudo coccoides]NDV61038.1 response regulator [Oceanipulchritudo coccoides]
MKLRKILNLGFIHMGSKLSSAGIRQAVILNPIVAFLIYLGSAGLGLEMALWQQFAPLIWPPAGFGLVLLLLGGLNKLPVIFIGATVIRFFESGGLGDALLFGTGYSLAAYLTVYVLNRFLNFKTGLESLKDVSSFMLFGVLLFPVISALISTASIWQFTPDFCPDFFSLFSVRWLSDALGVLVLAPFLLVWYSRTRINWRNEQTVEVLGWLAILIFLGALVFRNWAPSDTLRYPMELAMFPIMAWAAIRFGQRGVTIGILVISMMAVWELKDVIGPDATKTISQPPGYLWVFVGVLATTGLYLAATWTELREREEELRTNEERLRAFVHALPDLALVFGQDGICSEIFAPLNSHFRARMHSFRGKTLEEIYPRDLARKFADTIDSVIRDRNLEVVRYAISIDGDDRTYEGRFAPIESFEGQPPSVMVVSYDLTESQHARQDLQKRDFLLNALTRAESILLKEKVFHRGVRKAIECVGKGLSLDIVQVYQVRPGEDSADGWECTHEWLRESPFIFGSPTISGAELRKITSNWQTLIEDGEPWNMHYSSANEPTRSFLSQLGMRSLTIFGFRPDGGVAGYIVYGSTLERSEKDANTAAVLQAITESLRAYMETQIIQDQLREAKEAAVSADHAKSEFLAIMSHEIRTPMNAIIGFSDLLRQTEVSEQQGEYVDIITRSGKDLLELINNILDFSKLESNSVQLEHTRFNLETTLIEVLEMVLFRAKEKGITLDFEGNDDLRALFWGDPLRLRQVLLNLLTNAIKFTQKGSVTLEVLTVEKDSPWMTFEMRVIDTGIGIPEEHRGELFKAFQQVDSSTTREYGGTGLGLTIVQRLVDKMGGRVSLESTEGEGSTFSVVLRFEKDLQEAVEPSAKKPEDTLSKSFSEDYPFRILVVEDDLVNTRLICEVLSRLGYEADAVTDGYKALAVITEGRHDLVIMDMQMSRMDGLEATSRIRSGECGALVKNIPIIALTALALEEERARILESGVDHYLSKPIHLPSLKKILMDVSGDPAN